MACNRALLTQRCAITTSSLPDLVTQLDVIAQGKRKASSGDRARRVLMVFTGQGAQWAGVGQTLTAFPAYAKAVKEVDEIFKRLSGWSILERAEEIKPELAHETTYGAPVSFMVQVGLLHLLRQAGISPAMVRRNCGCRVKRKRFKIRPAENKLEIKLTFSVACHDFHCLSLRQFLNVSEFYIT